MSSQLRWRSLTYRHRGCRVTSQRAFKFLVAKVTYKMTPRFFTPKRWNRFFAIYVVRLAPYVWLKNICDCVGGQDESNGTPLDPPLFWLDNIFNGGFIKGILRGVRYTKSLRVLFLHRRPPSWTTLVLYSRAVFIFNEAALTHTAYSIQGLFHCRAEVGQQTVFKSL